MANPSFHVTRLSSLAEVLEVVARAVDAHTDETAPVALLDLDGTIWTADIGYACLDLALHTGLIASGHQPSIQALHELLAHHGSSDLRSLLLSFETSKARFSSPTEQSYRLGPHELPSAESVSLLETIYALCAGVFWGISETDITQLAQRALDAFPSVLGRSIAGPGVARTIRHDVAEIRSLLRSYGLLELVVTASPACIARAAATIIGVPHNQIIGVELASPAASSDIPVQRPMPIHSGKGLLAAAWCRDHSMVTPAIIAIGDSPFLTDYGLLEQSLLFVAVSGHDYQVIRQVQQR